MDTLQKIVKVTQQQYDILKNGGTVGDYTGLNSNYIYLVQEDYNDITYANLNSTASLGTIGLNKVYPIGLDDDNKLAVYVPWTDNNTTYLRATNKYLGLIKPWYSTTGASTYNGSSTAPSAGADNPSINARSTTSGRYYPVEMDANGRAYVNVPWTIPNATYDTRGIGYLGRAIHIDGTGYSTHGYYYDRNSDIQICFGTSLYSNGLISVTFARKFKGAPTVVLEPFFKNTSATSIGTQYRNAQTVRCYLVNGSATTSYSKTDVVTGFNFDSGNTENQYFNYIAIGQSASDAKYNNQQYEEPYVPPEQ